jgi:gas vesicle protein
MTSSDPEVIRRQIEDTRRELSYDVDALNEKVNPARVVDRRMSAAKGRVTRVKEKVMGSAHDTGQHAQGVASNAAGSVQDAASSAVDTVQQTPDMIVRQTQGNPLAAGLIAFGVGWLVSSLLPATEKEKQLAQQAETAVKENKDTLLAPAKDAAQQIGEELKPAAQQAVEEVKSTAQDAAQTVKEEGQSAAEDVKGQAQQSKDKVQSAQGSSSSTPVATTTSTTTTSRSY